MQILLQIRALPYPQPSSPHAHQRSKAVKISHCSGYIIAVFCTQEWEHLGAQMSHDSLPTGKAAQDPGRT